ncbi:MAG: sugar ABC transporter permease [Lachnospiraceae bacterium]|jgi:raffinose/stachyose/melibiose transport system permease protein|nr:sugar ABC transporter permease [Lachnospiraceae bacterium]MCI9133777.1 sugar ABC transporter permease [Lachnospiraceae bacterium]
MRQRNKVWIASFLAPALVLFILIYLGPLVLAFVSSFTKWNGMQSMRFIGLKNYADIVRDPVFRTALGHTLLWALLAVCIHVPFGVWVALVLKRKRKGWRFTRSVFMLPNIVSRSALSLMFVFIYKPDVGILNTALKAAGLEHLSRNWLAEPETALFSVTNIWLWYAAVITLIVFAELSSISHEIEESAKIDGATALQVDWYIYLPLLRRAIGTGAIVAVTAVFKEFECIYMTTNGGPGDSTMTISVMMVNKIIQSNQYGYANTLGILLLILGIATMLLCNKLFGMNRAD